MNTATTGKFGLVEGGKLVKREAGKAELDKLSKSYLLLVFTGKKRTFPNHNTKNDPTIIAEHEAHTERKIRVQIESISGENLAAFRVFSWRQRALFPFFLTI